MLYMPGDILFYSQHSIADKVISEYTSSRFVHVGIAISAYQEIASMFTGVTKQQADYTNVAAVYSYHNNALKNNKLLDAIEWLENQVGKFYGWGDIANAIIDKVKTGEDIHLLNDHYDCSALACQFLLIAGGTTIPATTDPHTVTPALLASLLKIV